MRQAVILAGGKGTRLRDRLGGRPKPLVDIDGKPLLHRQLEMLREAGISNVVLLVNHAANQIREFCDSLQFDDLLIQMVDDGEPRGTAGALTHAYDQLADCFLVVYGDTLFSVDIAHFWKVHRDAGADASLLLHPNDHPFDSDLVEINEQSRVIALHAAPHKDQLWLPSLVNAGMYVLQRDAVAFWRMMDTPSDIARDLFPAMLRRHQWLHGCLSTEYIKDIGTPARLDKALGQFRSGVVARARRSVAQRAVLLDRDGTINELRGHLAWAEDFTLIEGTGGAIRRLNEAEFRVVVITNQPVLARGEVTPAGLRRIHAKMETLLGHDGAFVDRVYYCPHHPDGGYPGEVSVLKIACNCRKPQPGLIERARAELNIDLEQSWLVGDSSADIALANRCGVRAILVRSGVGGHDGKYRMQPDFVVHNLADAVGLILERWPLVCSLAAPIAARCSASDIVLIGGLPHVGKSLFAAVLARLLRDASYEVIVIDVKRWLQDDTNVADVAECCDMAAVEAAVETLVIARISDASAEVNGTRLGMPTASIIIVEGHLVLLSKRLRALATLGVHVEAPEAERRNSRQVEARRAGVTLPEFNASDTLPDAAERPETYGVRPSDLRVLLVGRSLA